MSEAPFAGRRLHFIGVGGAGMSGLAAVTRELGAEVTGSDRSESPYVDWLRRGGLVPVIGHEPANYPAGAEVVVSTAIAEDNPELVAAREAGARVLHRAELLGELSRLKRCLAVTGTHGKTTTTGMAAHALTEAGRSPGWLVGGQLGADHANAAWGEGDWLVVEADESDRSFLRLSPEVAVVTNVELDHHASYRSLADLQGAVREFAAPAGSRVAGPGVELGPDQVSFGIESGDLRATALELEPFGARFEVDGVAVELAVPGRHNVLNALAALGGCRAAGLPIKEAAPALATFRGAGRRFEDRGRTHAGARVVDDYAHHPTELRAAIETARELGPERLVACFQPHLYSRTQRLARDFGRALALADLAVVLDIYPARELAEDYPGVSGLLVAGAAADAAAGRPVWWLPRMEDAEERLREELGDGDVLLTLGAGDVDRLAAALTRDGQ